MKTALWSVVLAGFLAGLAGCRLGSERSITKALVGATAIDPGGEMLVDSVLLIHGSRISAYGSRDSVSIPSAAEKWNVAGRWLIPEPIRLEEGVRLAHIDSMAEARVAMIKPPAVVEGLPTDAEQLPDDMVRRLSDNDTVVAPRLARLQASRERLDRGIRLTRQLLQARIRIASFAGPDAVAEWRLLAAAGMTPRQVLESATVNAARAARLAEEAGSLRPGFRGNVWVLTADPLANVDNLSQVESVMAEGEWKRSRQEAGSR